ncbi:MAG: hypothetical protein HYU66_00395 [Armatimonadetes bacterium]|nr:hypothetical protein [Armatimonadota bacterium]
MTNTNGKTYVSEVDEAAYTSCGWEYQEGKVGSPIRLVLKFRRAAP